MKFRIIARSALLASLVVMVVAVAPASASSSYTATVRNAGSYSFTNNAANGDNAGWDQTMTFQTTDGGYHWTLKSMSASYLPGSSYWTKSGSGGNYTVTAHIVTNDSHVTFTVTTTMGAEPYEGVTLGFHASVPSGYTCSMRWITGSLAGYHACTTQYAVGSVTYK
jgi:hypothetical protein